MLLAAAAAAPAPVLAQDCRRLQPDDVRLLVRARDAAGVSAALKCRRELLADERVRSALAYAFSFDNYPGNEAFLAALRRSGTRFLVDLAPLAAENVQENLTTPLGVALTQGNRPAVEWLLADARPADLRPYRRLAMPSLEPLLGRTTLDERHEALRAALQMAVSRGLPTDAGNHEAYFRALLVWWRTQDLVDYTDNSSGARFGPQPLPASAAPLWKGIADMLAPADAAAREQAQLRAAEAYVKTKLGEIDVRVDALKQTLPGAVARPGALVVDSMGIIDVSPGGRVPRESVEATIGKLEARAQRLRTALQAHLGSTPMPEWARAPGQQGAFGELLGLRLGDRYAELAGGREPPPCRPEPTPTFCARPADPPLAWKGEERLTLALNAAGRFPPGGPREPQLVPGSGDAANGIVRLDIPEAARRPGLPTSVDVVVRQGRIEALLMQGGQYGIAGALRRLWGDPQTAYTEWFRVREGRFYNRAIGTLELRSGETALLAERVYSGDDDRPVARYRWQGDGGSAEMVCEMACQLAIVAQGAGPAGRRATPGAGGPPAAATAAAPIAPSATAAQGDATPGAAAPAGAAVAPSAVAAAAADSAGDRTPPLSSEARARWAQLLPLMPKPPAPPAAPVRCDAEPVPVPLEALHPSVFGGDPGRAEGVRRGIALQLALWGRAHARFEGPGDCVHHETVARMWQAATGGPVTGQLSRQDLGAWTREVVNASSKVRQAGRKP